jgi:hypothetical protein
MGLWVCFYHALFYYPCASTTGLLVFVFEFLYHSGLYASGCAPGLERLQHQTQSNMNTNGQNIQPFGLVDVVLVAFGLLRLR